jgi:formylglycine-generating enzyme required for sulfatase activity
MSLSERARRRRLTAVVGALAVGLAGAGIVAAVTFTRGVALIIAPQQVQEIAAVEVIEGWGLTIANKVYALSGELVARVSAPGFHPATVPITATGSTPYVELTLQEIRPVLHLVFDGARAAETTWSVDGRIVDTGAATTLELPSGEYAVGADNPYFALESELITLQRAEERTLSITPRPIRGTLNVASIPGGADVLVDGEPAGQSGMSLALPGGEYAIEVRRDRYATATDIVSITRNNAEISRNYRLIADPGYLVPALSPSGGELFIDGRRRSAVTPGAPIALSSGTAHAIVYRKPGFTTATATIELAPGERRELALQLSEDVGVVRVRSSPPADVRIDDTFVGRTPLDLELPAIEVVITVSEPGYVSTSRRVLPSAASERLMDVTLPDEQAYRFANAPATYTNSVGAEMLRFVPRRPFTMGAPRSERGQRANEVLREVQLTRPFYVSRTEITAAQFARFRAGTAGGSTPVTDVGWEEAARFCNWLSEREGLNSVYRFRGAAYGGADTGADGYRLPTEAEWEWLARQAGRRGAQTRFTWGDDYVVPASAANLADESAKNQPGIDVFIPRYNDGHPALAPAGSFASERSGLFDLSGNASEWVHDYYGIPSTPDGEVRVDPTGPAYGEGHVVKGSSYRSGRPSGLRASWRDPATEPRDDLGFRIARYVTAE